MSERYWITGVQLGLLQTKDLETKRKVVEEIIGKQFIGNFFTEQEQKTFKIIMDNFEVISTSKAFADFHIEAYKDNL